MERQQYVHFAFTVLWTICLSTLLVHKLRLVGNYAVVHDSEIQILKGKQKFKRQTNLVKEDSSQLSATYQGRWSKINSLSLPVCHKQFIHTAVGTHKVGCTSAFSFDANA